MLWNEWSLLALGTDLRSYHRSHVLPILALLAPCRVLFPEMKQAATFQALLATEVDAMSQVPREYAVGTLRLSTGRHTVTQDIVKAVELIARSARQQGVPVL